MSATNNDIKVEGNKNPQSSLDEKVIEKTSWCGRYFNIGTLGCLLGTILLVGGIAMLILKAINGLDLYYPGILSVAIGAANFALGLSVHSCIKNCGGKAKDIQIQEAKPAASKVSKYNINAPEVVSKTPLSKDIETRAFFESKGIFGLPQTLIDELTIWRLYREDNNLDIELNAGCILYGPPGTGKTTIATNIAELLGGEYHERKCGDLMSVSVGGTEQNISALFQIPEEEFRIITIDEISGMFQKRTNSVYSQWTDRFTNHFLSQLGGTAQTHPKFILIGTTNEFDSLDPALVRDGRLGGHFEIQLPDSETREKLFKFHLTKANVKSGAMSEDQLTNLAKKLAANTDGFSGSEIVIGVIGAAKKTAALSKRPHQASDYEEQVRIHLENKQAEQKN